MRQAGASARRGTPVSRANDANSSRSESWRERSFIHTASRAFSAFALSDSVMLFTGPIEAGDIDRCR